MFDPSPELCTMMRAARLAGEGLMGRFARPSELVVSLKGRADFVSSADLESEATLRGVLLGAYPDFGFVAEESAGTAGQFPPRRAFIVDPLDGTTNFVRGIPHFAIAIALEDDGRVLAGVVFDPTMGEMFVAEEGRGAYLGERRL